MCEFEEETYSTVFTALKHPIRRKILRVLSDGPRTFTDLQNNFNVNSPVLTYHLESMKDLVSKTEESKYRLSTMGEGAMALMERVEEPPKQQTTEPSPPRRKRVLTLAQSASIFLAIGLLVGGLYLNGISTVQTTYPLPTETYEISGHVEVNGVGYNTSLSIYTIVPPSMELFRASRGSEIFVKANYPLNITDGIYNMTLRYLAYLPSEERYVQKEVNCSGRFSPSQITWKGFLFSDYPQIPISEGIGRGAREQPVPQDIVVGICTNATYQLPSPLFSVETDVLSGQFGYSEKYPYRDLGDLYISVAILTLIAAFALAILQPSRKSP